MKKSCARFIALCLLAALPVSAQAPTDINTQIRAEETDHSKIMWLIHEIADVHGPRVTGSPNLRSAEDWAVSTFNSWGMKNAHLEPWSFQPPSAAAPVKGWENMELQADAISPFHGQLMVMPLAWTPSTKGAVTAEVVQITPPGMAAPGGGGGFGGAAAANADAKPAAPAGT